MASTTITFESIDSTNEFEWIEASLPVGDNWLRVCYAAGKFVAVSSTSDKSVYSTDGVPRNSRIIKSSMALFTTDILLVNGRPRLCGRNDDQMTYTELTFTSY
jgi:hypothetical protein